MSFIVNILLIILSPLIMLPYGLYVLAAIIRDPHYVEKRYWKNSSAEKSDNL